MVSLAAIVPTKLAAETVESGSAEALMVPLTGIETMLRAGSLLAIEIVPEGFPPDAGLSRTVIVSWPPGAMTNELVMAVTLKLEARLSMLVMLRIAVPVLRSVSRRLTTVFGATTPKSIAAGAVITGAVPGWLATVRIW